MTCAEIAELLPGYILEALDAAEMDAVDDHLMTCREHDADLVDLRSTGLALALLEDDPGAGATPPPHLRERVLAVAGPRALRLPEDDSEDADGPPAWSAEPPVRRRGPGRTWWLGAAAAAVGIALFGGGWYGGVHYRQPVPETVRYSWEMRGAEGQIVRFSGIEGAERVTVTMDGLGAQPDGRQYQIWAIRDGKWQSLGSCNTNARGWWRGDFEFTLRRGDEVALTVEPTGGSPKPTSPSLLRTKF